MTIGINFHSVLLPFKYQQPDYTEEKYIVNSIFDFGGQDRFKSLIPKFLKGADGALLLFDSVSYSSFDKLHYWSEQIEIQVEDELNSSIPKILVGCKSDLLKTTSESEIVNKAIIDDFMYEKSIDAFHYTSALDNVNILKVFNQITHLIFRQREIEVFI